MLYMIFLFIVSGLAGTVLALRFMALEAEVKPSKLTRRGKIVVGLFWGVAIAMFVVFICGFWWDCDLTDSSSVCSVAWGY